MIEYVASFVEKVSNYEFDILLFLGLALFTGSLGGRLFQKKRIPQVLGYILIGVIIGPSGFKFVGSQIIETLQPFNYFALGMIGFIIGGELKKEVFKRYGRQFAYILLFEGMTAFLLVFLSVGIVGTFLLGMGKLAWPLGLLLGAIASATAPAATTDVLWEYKTRGPLTTTILGIVALDDGLALLLFAVASSIAAKLIGSDNGSLMQTIMHPVYEIVMSVFIGVVFGLILTYLIKKYTERERLLAFSIAVVLLVLGLSVAMKVDMLLASMTLGMVIVNLAPRQSKEVFKLIGGFATPIYVLFFVMVGAKLNVSHLNLAIVVLVLTYLVSRTAGKMFGARFGARISNAPQRVREYLPYCLFSQAGVAIGLSILAAQIFPGDIGNSIVIIITTTTFVVQIIGPPMVKYAVTKAGEVGLNITEEDLIRKTKAIEVMDRNYPLIKEDTSLAEVFKIFSSHPYLYYPVVDQDTKIKGVITVHSIKQTFIDADLKQLLLACDLMEPVIATASEQVNLYEAIEIMDKYAMDYLLLVSAHGELAGFLERNMLQKIISTKYLELQKQAEVVG